MRNKVIVFLVLLISGSIASALEIKDLNGTYVESEEYLRFPRVHDAPFSWGWGKTIVDGAIEFDLGKNVVNIPWMGQYKIAAVNKEGEDTICLTLFSVEESHKDTPVYIKVTFIDADKVYIECSEWKNWHNETYSPEAKWVWYRLSGPKGSR